jgi:hypothetical protein
MIDEGLGFILWSFAFFFIIGLWSVIKELRSRASDYYYKRDLRKANETK